MLKKDSVTTAKLSVGHKCGECLHHQKVPKYEKACIKLGVTRAANAPSCFSPNVFDLQKHSPDVLNKIGFLLKDFSPAQSRLLLALLRASKSFSRFKLRFGQPVYVRLGNDYLSNYYLGYVVSVTAHGDPRVYVTTDLNRKQTDPAIMALLPESVHTVSAFKRVRERLTRSKKLVDLQPLFNKVAARKAASPDYEVPTLESVPQSWFANFSDRAKVAAKNQRQSSSKVRQGLDGSLSFSVKR